MLKNRDSAIRQAPTKDRINPEKEISFRYREGEIIRDSRGKASFYNLEDGRTFVITNGTLEYVTKEKLAERLNQEKQLLEQQLDNQEKSLKKNNKPEEAIDFVMSQVQEMQEQLKSLLMVVDDLKKEKAIAIEYTGIERRQRLDVEEKLKAVKRSEAQLARTNEKLEELALLDGLTGLYNRRSFNDDIKDNLRESERTEENVALLFIDIDHFKKFNDNYGHNIGDLTLREVSKTIETNVRAGEKIYRYGGEEFIVICKGGDPQILAERILETVSLLDLNACTNAQNNLPNVTVSIGVATASKEHDTHGADSLQKAADEALYRAKGNGRNQVVYDKSVPQKK